MVLKKQMINAIAVNHAVWVIHPVRLRREMNFWPVLFVRCFASNLSFGISKNQLQKHKANQ
jgi:hypothetical protein